MDERRKTALFWLAAVAVFLFTGWLAVISAPPMFSSHVEPRKEQSKVGLAAVEYLERFGKTDVNHATAEELSSLPMMDEELARHVAAERDRRQGGFSSLAELASVEGVTAEMLVLWEGLLFCG